MNLAFRLASDPAASGSPDAARLPGSLQVNRKLNQWLRFVAARADQPEHVLLLPGKVELGQGIGTALAQIAADELGLRLDQIRLAPASTTTSPDEAVTSGSLSIQECGTAIRHACAQARALLSQAAAPGTSYWRPDAEELLNCEATASSALTAVQDYRWVGQSMPRRDLAAKFAGEASFVQDLRFEGMKFSAVLRHLAQGHDLIAGDPARAQRLAAIARTVIEQTMAGPATAGPVQVLVDHCFVALIADRYLQLDRVLRVLEHRLAESIERGEWPIVQSTALAASSAPAASPDSRDDDDARSLSAWFEAQPAQTNIVFEWPAVTSASAASPDTGTGADALRRWDAEFIKPWLAHGSIGLSTAIALWRLDGRLEVWTHSQGIFNLRRDLFLSFGSRLNIAEDAILVHHVPGAGCYGHNGADDVAFDAARCAIAAAGSPVRLQWTRAQEFSSAPFSPAMKVRVTAAVDSQRRLSQWHHELWSQGHSSRPGRAAVAVLQGACEISDGAARIESINPPLAAGGGADRNAVPAYNIAQVTVINHRLRTSERRSSAFRGLGAIANVFALESMIEQIANDLNEDPLDFRLRHLDRAEDFRARAVIEAAARLSDWRSWRQAARVNRGAADQATDQASAQASGLGMGFARYKNSGAWCCAVAKVEVSDQVRVRQLWIAADVGLVINPDGARNQLEGGAVQASSIALLEQMRFAGARVAGFDWEQYRIMRFSEVPAVELELIDRKSEAALGAGEASMGPVVAAIGNGLAQALGFRMRSLPMSAQRVRAAMESS